VYTYTYTYTCTVVNVNSEYLRIVRLRVVVRTKLQTVHLQ
jgi:hypothetical protein